jgi:hypothetical protein
MEILYHHNQVKIEKTKNLKSECNLKLAHDGLNLNYIAEYTIEYVRYEKINYIIYEHALNYNIKNGNFSVIYRIKNGDDNTYNLHRTNTKIKKNSFDDLLHISHRGFYAGERRYNFWGVKYKKACVDMLKIISETLNHSICLDKSTHGVNQLYDMLVEHHLTKKNIKWHNNIYNDISQIYPSKKYLKLNDNKFLPAALDSLGIKSKLLIGTLSNLDKKINMKSLKYLCDLFGENYVQYFRYFDWVDASSTHIGRTKKLYCEDEHERTSLVSCFKSYDSGGEYILTEKPLQLLSQIYTLKSYLKCKGLDVKVRGRSYNDLISLKNMWELHKKHFKLGHKLKYFLPNEMVLDLEETIIINEKKFIPQILLSEDQFMIEGMKMNNCMYKQFNVANLYVHLTVIFNKKRVNLQYRYGLLVQSKGKANIPVPKEFKDVIEIINKKMLKYQDVTPKKIEYDFMINN